MKLIAVALALSTVAPSGEASEVRSAAPALQLKPKAAILGTSTPVHKSAPFQLPTGEPELDLVPKHRQEASRSSCSGESSLCYDQSSGRIVYKPARNYMPDIPGLQRENISVRRDRIVFRYSF